MARALCSEKSELRVAGNSLTNLTAPACLSISRLINIDKSGVKGSSKISRLQLTHQFGECEKTTVSHNMQLQTAIVAFFLEHRTKENKVSATKLVILKLAETSSEQLAESTISVKCIESKEN